MPKLPPNNLDQLMNDPKAAGLLKNRAALEALLRSPDTQKLMSMLEQAGGDGLQKAAASAANGDPSALKGMMDQVMRSEEGAAVVNRLQKQAPK
ncbi:hypothetical protein D1159_02000 [Pseudoflavonifractor sp. 524-17]|uniref:hypothetical protein n=1 Tax=Pseudoflavonifractor sp. 524-17 TaxID=2304577 RepID=UPI001379595D|nr:hypothetical protein [Pseudoflavonifractor sp. 524-17]NCE63380.1 hypothetical protein [Pseudoflavonifractor sp. 524-17]